MSCGAGPVVLSDKCAACLTCLRVCPFDVPVVTDVAEMHSCLCQGCGICAAECPAEAIVMAGWEPGAVRAEAAGAIESLDGAPSKLLVYVCGHHAPASLWTGSWRGRPEGVKEVLLTSMSRLDVEDVMAAFEAGADGVLVVACRSGACRYPQVEARLRRRVARAKVLLDEIGLGAERLRVVTGLGAGGEEDVSALTSAATGMAESLASMGRSPSNVGC
jgi:coenzyme F420-reducing hydrogenase delta subunit